MRNKKQIMGIAGILVLIFHFYIPITSLKIEQTIKETAYIGVDIFFFLSAYTLGHANIDNWRLFLKNRIQNVYIPFCIICFWAKWIHAWTWIRFIKIIFGIEFLESGGGAFLWFFPCIMAFYLCTPVLNKCRKGKEKILKIVLILLWIIGAFFIQYELKLAKIFIFYNRIPIILIGYFMPKENWERKNRKEVVCSIIGLSVAAVLMYKFGTGTRLQYPFINAFYLTSIPYVVFLIRLLNYSEILNKNRVFKEIGKSTLWMYGIQMTIGYQIEVKLLNIVQYRFVAFVAAAAIIIISAFSANMLYNKICSKNEME